MPAAKRVHGVFAQYRRDGRNGLGPRGVYVGKIDPIMVQSGRAVVKMKIVTWQNDFSISKSEAPLKSQIEFPPFTSEQHCGGRMIIIEVFERGATPRHRPSSPIIAVRIDTS